MYHLYFPIRKIVYHFCSSLCRFVGPYTFFSPSLSFILEDDIGVCGYVLAALDSRSFYDQFVTEWAPEVAKRYPLPHVGIKELTPEEVCTYIRTYKSMYVSWYFVWLIVAILDTHCPPIV